MKYRQNKGLSMSKREEVSEAAPSDGSGWMSKNILRLYIPILLRHFQSINFFFAKAQYLSGKRALKTKIDRGSAEFMSI